MKIDLKFSSCVDKEFNMRITLAKLDCKIYKDHYKVETMTCNQDGRTRGQMRALTKALINIPRKYRTKIWKHYLSTQSKKTKKLIGLNK